MADQPFWIKKTLQEMNQDEWESVCDGCGKCCLHKLEDEDTGDVFYTAVACKLLDIAQCRCSDYEHRKTRVQECLSLSKDNLTEFEWLPITCAYRLLAEGKPLAEWHPLVSGNKESVHKVGMSVKDFALSEANVPEEEFEEYILKWVV